MEGIIKIRLPNDLWWTEIEYSTVLKWVDLEITYLSDETCFAKIIDSNNNKTQIELYRKDYDKIINQRVFRLKFNLKKHKITNPPFDQSYD